MTVAATPILVKQYNIKTENKNISRYLQVVTVQELARCHPTAINEDIAPRLQSKRVIVKTGK